MYCMQLLTYLQMQECHLMNLFLEDKIRKSFRSIVYDPETMITKNVLAALTERHDVDTQFISFGDKKNLNLNVE